MIYDPEYIKIIDMMNGFIRCSRCGDSVHLYGESLFQDENLLIKHINSDECIKNTRERKLKELLNKKI